MRDKTKSMKFQWCWVWAVHNWNRYQFIWWLRVWCLFQIPLISCMCVSLLFPFCWVFIISITNTEAVECDRGESTRETAAASQCDSSSSSDSICVYNTLDQYQADGCNTYTAAQGDDCINSCKYSSALITAKLKILPSSISQTWNVLCIVLYHGGVRSKKTLL